MAFAKTTQFEPRMLEMAEFATALSHPGRIAILMHLLDFPGARCGDLLEILSLSQPSCSRHLGALRKANLVEARPQGNEVHYYLKFERIKHFCDAFRASLNPPQCGKS